MLNLDGDDTFGDEELDRSRSLGTCRSTSTEQLTRAARPPGRSSTSPTCSRAPSRSRSSSRRSTSTSRPTADPNAGGDLENAVMTSFAMQILADDGDDANGDELGLTIGDETGVHFKVESGSLLYVSSSRPRRRPATRASSPRSPRASPNAELLGHRRRSPRRSSRSRSTSTRLRAAFGTDPLAEARDWTGRPTWTWTATSRRRSSRCRPGADPIELTLAYEGDVLGASGPLRHQPVRLRHRRRRLHVRRTPPRTWSSASTETLTDAQVTRLVAACPRAVRRRARTARASASPAARSSSRRSSRRRPRTADRQRRSWIALDGDARVTARSRASRTSTLDVRQRDARDQPGVRHEAADRGRGARLDRPPSCDGAVRRSTDLDGVEHPIEFDDEALRAPGDGDVQRVRLRRRHRQDHRPPGGRGRRPRRRRHRRPHRRAAAHDRARDQPGAATTPLFIGVNGVGFEIDSRHDLRRVAEGQGRPRRAARRRPTRAPGSAIAANLTGAGLVGLPDDFVFVADELEIEVNQAAGGTTPPDPLDWGAASTSTATACSARTRRGMTSRTR